MHSRPNRVAVISLFAFAFLAVGSHQPLLAEDASQPNQTLRSRMREDLLRMNDFFDTMLPGTLSQYNIVLKFAPKFSDLRDNEYVRYPFELRYGLTPRWELFGGMSPYHPNPFNDGRDHRWGFGQLRSGARYDLGKIWFYDEATASFEVRTPLGAPPIEIIGRYTHLAPLLTASRKLSWVPHTTFFTNFGYDREINTPTRDRPPVSKMHVAGVGPGLLYKPGEFGLFGEYRFRHITTDAGSHNAHDSKVGVLWDVPLVRTQRYLPGKWQIELAYKHNREEGMETDEGVTARVSWRTTLREVLKAPEKSVKKK
jgi:hypothetical protein